MQEQTSWEEWFFQIVLWVGFLAILFSIYWYRKRVSKPMKEAQKVIAAGEKHMSEVHTDALCLNGKDCK